ncbi:hypothetical protein TYRP_011496 [Tyrophagus putrescentiae]|nr:hypothetical protein TYRP_011496 [Tyrophagus putrescentiae]
MFSLRATIILLFLNVILQLLGGKVPIQPLNRRRRLHHLVDHLRQRAQRVLQHREERQADEGLLRVQDVISAAEDKDSKGGEGHQEGRQVPGEAGEGVEERDDPQLGDLLQAHGGYLLDEGALPAVELNDTNASNRFAGQINSLVHDCLLPFHRPLLDAAEPPVQREEGDHGADAGQRGDAQLIPEEEGAEGDLRGRHPDVVQRHDHRVELTGVGGHEVDNLAGGRLATGCRTQAERLSVDGRHQGVLDGVADGADAADEVDEDERVEGVGGEEGGGEEVAMPEGGVLLRDEGDYLSVGDKVKM